MKRISTDNLSTILLTTGKACLALRVENAAGNIVRKCLSYFDPVFCLATDQPMHCGINIRHYDSFRRSLPDEKSESFVIRKSSAKPFNLSARRFRKDNTEIVLDLDSKTAYHLDRSTRTLDIFVSEQSLFHLLETIRYTFLSIEQLLGTAIVHASAVQANGSAVLIVGGKGKGKTTTLLEFVLNQGYKFFSGDKVLIDVVKDNLRIRAWPDYPHVGYGTLSRFPSFAKACGISLSQDDMATRWRKKVLVEPNIYIRNLGGLPETSSSRCGAIIFPDVLQPLVEAVEITALEERERLLMESIEDARLFTPGQWHGLVSTPPPPDATGLVSKLVGSRWLKCSGTTPTLRLEETKYG